MESKDDLSAAVCALCAELDPALRCSASHHICHSCAAAYMRGLEKGSSDPVPLCPVAKCEAMIDLEPVAATTTDRRLARLLKLDPTTLEYTNIEKSMRGSAWGPTISAIFRIENPALRAIFEACRTRMTKERPADIAASRKKGAGSAGGADERRLFHATTRAAAGGVVREGFDTHRSGGAHGQRFGPGIYLALHAGFANGYADPDAAGLRAILVVDALLGGADGRYAVEGDAGLFSHQFVAHREQQVLPRYLVYYTDSSSAPAVRTKTKISRTTSLPVQ